MKLSIWQQFSSNHSATFTVMGKFETPEQAREVAETIREILVKVARWREQFQTDEEDDDLTAPDHTDSEMALESELLEQYGLDAPLETLEFARDSSFAADAVLVFDRVVIVSEGLIDEYTWSGSWAFEEYLKKRGAEVTAYSEGESKEITIDITCIAPDEVTADDITRRWNATRDGLNIDIHDFHEEDYGQNFLDLIEYLQTKGCNAIDYRFRGD
jgi:hypothetical protein